MKTLVDTSERVSKVSQQIFLPTFAMWTIELNKLEADLYPSFLGKLIDLVKVRHHPAPPRTTPYHPAPPSRR